MPLQVTAYRPNLNLNWLAAVLTNWMVIAAAVTVAWQWGHVVGFLLAVFVVGTRQHALAVLGHDATHFHVSRNRRANDLLGNLLVAWPIGYSFSGYRRWHFEHHRTVGTEDNPELMMYRMFEKKWAAGANQFKLFMTDLLGFGCYEVAVLWYDLMRWRPAQPGWRRVEETLGLVLWPISAASLIASLCGWQASLLAAALWYGAAFTSFFAVYRMRCYTEHVGSEWTHQLQQPALWQRLLYLPANTWLHFEHHTWPGIPLRRLKYGSQGSGLPRTIVRSGKPV